MNFNPLDAARRAYKGLRGNAEAVPGGAAAQGKPVTAAVPYTAIDPKVTGTRGLSAPQPVPANRTPEGMTAQDHRISRFFSQRGPVPMPNEPEFVPNPGPQQPRFTAPFQPEPPTANANYQPRMGTSVPNMDPLTGQPIDAAKGLAPKAVNNGLGVSSYGSEFVKNAGAPGAAGAGTPPGGARGFINQAGKFAGAVENGKIVRGLGGTAAIVATPFAVGDAYRDAKEMDNLGESTALFGEKAGRVAGGFAGAGLGGQAGAALGTALLPGVGTVAGGAIGGLAGGALGAFAPDLLKKATDAVGLTDKTTLLPSDLAEQRRTQRGVAAIDAAKPAAAAGPAPLVPTNADPGAMDVSGSVGVNPMQDVQQAQARYDVNNGDLFDRFNQADARGLRTNKGYTGDNLAERGNVGIRNLLENTGGSRLTQGENGQTIETAVPSAMDNFNALQQARGNGIRATTDARGGLSLEGDGNAARAPVADTGFNLADQNKKMEAALRANNDLPSMHGAGVMSMGGGNVLEQAAARKTQQRGILNAQKNRELDIAEQTKGATQALGIANYIESVRQHNIENDFKGKDYARNVAKDKLEQSTKLNSDNRAENEAMDKRIDSMIGTTQVDQNGKQSVFARPEDKEAFKSFVRSNPGAYDLNNDASLQHAANAFQLNKQLQSGDRSMLGKLATWAGFEAPQTSTNLTVKPTGVRNTTVGDYLMNKDVGLGDLAFGRPKLTTATGHVANIADLMKTPEGAAELISRMSPQQVAALKKHMER